MPSPFPGMNPYLERRAVWSDFHGAFVMAVRDALAPLVRPAYFVAVEEHIYLHELSDDEPPRRVGDADVSVHPTGRRLAGGAAVARRSAPAFVYVPPAVERVRFLAVRDRDGNRTVTVIEVLSRSNKYAGADRDQYIGKQSVLLSTDVNFVELDLLRGGPRMPWPDLPACDYYAIVSRPDDRPRSDIWPVRLREPLPEIPVPLRPGEDEPVLDLQAILHRVYDAAGYDLRAYAGDPEPQLSAEDAAWAEAILTPTGP